METEVKTKVPSPLIDKKVVLMPSPRQGAINDDPKHKGYFKYDGTKTRFIVPMDIHRGGLINPLTDAERLYFEELLGEDLNSYKKKDNFWHKFEVLVTKDDELMRSGFLLDLSNPTDYLRWKVLLTNNDIVAPSWEERLDSGEYVWALRDLGYTENDRVKKAEIMTDVYSQFKKIQASKTKMFDLLCVFWLQNNKAKRPPEDAKADTYINMIQEIIDNTPQKFLDITKDANYEMKLLVTRALHVGAIQREGMREFTLDSGKFLGKTLSEVVINLTAPEFNTEMIRIKALIEG